MTPRFFTKGWLKRYHWELELTNGVTACGREWSEQNAKSEAKFLLHVFEAGYQKGYRTAKFSAEHASWK